MFYGEAIRCRRLWRIFGKRKPCWMHWKRKKRRKKSENKKVSKFRHWQAHRHTRTDFFSFFRCVFFCSSFYCKRIILFFLFPCKEFSMNAMNGWYSVKYIGDWVRSVSTTAIGAESEWVAPAPLMCVAKEFRYCCVCSSGVWRNVSHNGWTLIKQHSVESTVEVNYIFFHRHTLALWTHIIISGIFDEKFETRKWCEFRLWFENETKIIFGSKWR